MSNVSRNSVIPGFINTYQTFDKSIHFEVENGTTVMEAAIRNAVLLGASIFFYAFAEPVFVFVLAGTCLLDWLLGRAMVARPTRSWRRFCLAANIVVNLGVLFWVKYANFAVANFDQLLAPHGLRLAIASVALPVGVSFVTFEKISYAVDIYRGVSRPGVT